MNDDDTFCFKVFFPHGWGDGLCKRWLALHPGICSNIVRFNADVYRYSSLFWGEMNWFGKHGRWVFKRILDEPPLRGEMPIGIIYDRTTRH